MELIVVDLPGYEGGMGELVAGVSLPVLQDTSSDGVADAYGAERWYIYLVDRQGVPRVLHYGLDLDAERDRLLGEIAELVASR